jgi:predicted MFS family arabinose efflux permease
MPATFHLAIADLRICAIAIARVLLGFTYASTFPCQSLIGPQQLGMSERQFGLLIFAIGFAGMMGNLVIGYLSDLARDRKTAVLLCLAAGFVGFGSFAHCPSLESFIFCVVLITPFSNSAYALLFGTLRSITIELGPRKAGSVNAAIRSFCAIS